MKYTDEMKSFLREFIPGHTTKEIAAAFYNAFGIKLTKSKIQNLKTKLGVKSGTIGGRFERGHVPANKGKSWEEQGISEDKRQRMLSTCYKPGNMPHNAKDKPIGYERVTKDGYVEVKIADRPTQKERNDNFRMKHHIIWEEENGKPVPPSTMIVFADGDKRNFDPGNLVAVPRNLWSVITRKRIPYYDRESLEQAMAIARLDRKIYERRLDPRICGCCGSSFKPRYANQRTCDICLESGRRSPRRKHAQ